MHFRQDVGHNLLKPLADALLQPQRMRSDVTNDPVALPLRITRRVVSRHFNEVALKVHSPGSTILRQFFARFDYQSDRSM